MKNEGYKYKKLSLVNHDMRHNCFITTEPLTMTFVQFVFLLQT